MTEIRSLSTLLEDVRTHMGGKTDIYLSDLLDEFHERGFGFFLFLFALPAALPLPAVGIGTLLALPLIFLTAQQALGRHTLWLPEKLQKRAVSAEQLTGFIEAAQPWIKRLEFFIRPRLGFITQRPFSYIAGAAGFIMALSVLFPVPLTNTVPSMGIALMAIGVLMRDGLAVLAGMTIGLIWVGLLIFAVITFGPEGLDWVKETVKSIV